MNGGEVEFVFTGNTDQLKEKFKDAANKKAIEDGEQVYLSSNLINDFTALEDKISGTIEPTDIFKVLVKTDAWKTNTSIILDDTIDNEEDYVENYDSESQAETIENNTESEISNNSDNNQKVNFSINNQRFYFGLIIIISFIITLIGIGGIIFKRKHRT
jgi:ABC-type antimicrobial peptide transport system permease subunit